MPTRTSKRRLAAALGDYVGDKYAAAKEAKQAHFTDMQRCLRLLRGDDARLDGDPDTLDLNIIAPIVQGVVAMIQDVLGSAVEAPYTLAPTPVPDLPDGMRDQLIQAVQENLPGLLAAAGGDQNKIASAVATLRKTLLSEETRRAITAAKNMDTLVHDRLVDAGWTNEFLDFITNFVIYPVAVMKAPITTVSRVKRWTGQRLAYGREEIRKVENISPFDFYPAPNSKSVQLAEYVCERRNMTATYLLNLVQLDGYDAEAIRKILKDNPDGFAEPYEDGGKDQPESDNDNAAVDTAECNGTYDAIGFYGRIPGRYLKNFGVEIDDELLWYEAEVWSVDRTVFFAQLNPNPQEVRPFYTASMYPTPGSIYGSCVPLRLEDTQRVATAAVRQLVRNMAFAAGITGEVNPDQLADDEDPRVVLPNQLRMTKGGYNGTNVIKITKVESHAAELMGVFDKFLSLGYELIGIPRLAFGSPTNVGSVGRTSGGLSILMNQAAKPIKMAMRALERCIVEPVVQNFVDEELLYNPDPTIKGDIRVRAKGVSGIEEQEQRTEKLTWALQSIASLPPGVVPQTATLRLLSYIFEAYGIPTKGVLPDFELQDALSEDIGLSSTDMGGAPAALNSPTATAPLDGRSASAQQAIAASNGQLPAGGSVNGQG